MCGTCGITKNNIKFNDLYPSYYRPQTKFAKAMFSLVSVCPQEGVSLSRGVSVQVGSMSGGVSVRETHYTVMCERYASYWNAFLFLFCFLVFLSVEGS